MDEARLLQSSTPVECSQKSTHAELHNAAYEISPLIIIICILVTSLKQFGQNSTWFNTYMQVSSVIFP